MTDSDNTTPHISHLYDVDVENTIPYYSTFHRETINLIRSLLNEPKSWLDAGCGTGTLIKQAADVFPNTKFLLMDPSEAMLDQARAKLSTIPEDRLIFLEPSTTQDFSQKLEQKLDVITAIQSHHYLHPQERIKATKNCYHLLKEDGLFITFENIKPLTEDGIRIGKRYWGEFQLSHGRTKDTVKNHLKRFNVGYFPITIEEHLNLLKRTGFKVVELLWYSYMQAGFYCLK